MMRFLALLCCLLWCRTVAAAPPNVVFIVSDDQCWTDYGFMKHPVVQTPHLDRLAAQSLTFTHGRVPTSLCCPSLASLLTGRYPHETKVTGNEPPWPAGQTDGKRYKDPGFLAQVKEMNAFITAMPRLPAELAKAGYLSLQTGKWWAGNFASGGFTHGMSAGDVEHGGRHGDEGLKIGRQSMDPIPAFLDEATAAKKPFFLWYAPMLPHDPHTPPERLLAKYRDKTPSLHVARYWAMVEWFDETCGTLLKMLDDRGLAEDTLVVYLTDNGWIQREDGPRFRPDSKLSPYDGGLRTPIMLRWPGKVAPRLDATSVSSLDLMPTVLKACGVTAPEGLPGIDLLDDKALAAHPPVFGACFLHNSRDLHAPAKSVTWRWTADREWKLILPRPENITTPPRPGWKPEPELYRIAEDPLEQKNLASEHPEVLARLRSRLDAWWAAE